MWLLTLISIALIMAGREAISMPCRNCPNTPATGVCKTVTIEPCDVSPCELKRGTNVTFSVEFVAGQAATELQAVVYGIISGVPIRFELPNPDGCKDSGITCPITSGQTYTYTDSLFVSKLYPSLNLFVKWSLLDQSSNTVFCIITPAKID